jgi:hypothetical protein
VLHCFDHLTGTPAKQSLIKAGFEASGQLAGGGPSPTTFDTRDIVFTKTSEELEGIPVIRLEGSLRFTSAPTKIWPVWVMLQSEPPTPIMNGVRLFYRWNDSPQPPKPVEKEPPGCGGPPSAPEIDPYLEFNDSDLSNPPCTAFPMTLTGFAFGWHEVPGAVKYRVKVTR